jgi:hypothetical protein
MFFFFTPLQVRWKWAATQAAMRGAGAPASGRPVAWWAALDWLPLKIDLPEINKILHRVAAARDARRLGADISLEGDRQFIFAERWSRNHGSVQSLSHIGLG